MATIKERLASLETKVKLLLYVCGLDVGARGVQYFWPPIAHLLSSLG